MTDELFFEGARYIPAGNAANISNFTRDYIARLARKKKIVRRQIGRQWYVREDSLRAFVIEQEYANSKRRGELTRERQQEYERVQGVSASQKAILPSQASSAALGAAAVPVAAFDLHRKLASAAM